MNLNTLVKHYSKLTPEERFALILNASARGDDAEKDRLRQSSGRVTYSTADYTPFAEALQELALSIFMELADLAAEYLSALHRSCEVEDQGEHDADAEDLEDNPNEATTVEIAGSPLWSDACESQSGTDQQHRSNHERQLDLFLAYGYMLKTRWEGWQLWCERRGFPALLLWEDLPGYGRLRHTIGMTQRGTLGIEGAAFTDQGMLRWLNRGRAAAGKSEIEKLVPVSGQADEMERYFRERARFHAG